MFKKIFTLTFITFIIFSNNAQKLSVEKIWKNYEFFGNSINGFKSMKDGNYFSKITQQNGGITITKHLFSKYKEEGEIIVPSEMLKYKEKTLQIDDYFFNKDETKVLITTKTKPIYRRSFSAVYYILNLVITVLYSATGLKH